jgi:hypothetical protein
MADWTRDETTTTRRSYRLHTPHSYIELYKMLHAAENDYKLFHGLPDKASEMDVHLTVGVGDDEVIVYFDYPGAARIPIVTHSARHTQ